MKKLNSYTNPENQDKSSLREPEVVYHAALPYMSKAEALQHGMTLEDSKKILFEKIHQDFRR